MSCADVETIQPGNGSTTLFSFDFPYLFKSDIQVSFWNATTKEWDVKAQNDATYPWQITNANPTIVEFTGTAPPAPAVPVDPNETAVDNVRISRVTNIDSIRALFNPGSAIRSDDLNKNFEQLRYAIQEANCQGISDELYQYLLDNYWDRFDNTIYSGDAWVSNDTKLVTTGAIDNRVDSKIDTALTTDIVAGSSITITDNSPANGQITIGVNTDFGSQNVLTTGTSTAANFTPTSSTIPTNGVYLPSANTVGLSTNGTGRVFIDQYGNVGIGTSTPSSFGFAGDLVVSNINSFATGITLENNSSSSLIVFAKPNASSGIISYGHSLSQLEFYTNSLKKFTINSTGQLQSENLGNNAAPVYSFANDADTGIYSSGGNELAIATGGVGRLFVDSNGKVGLGTATPGSYSLSADNLVIVGSANEGISIISGNTNAGNIWFGDSNAQGQGAVIYNHLGDQLAFATNGIQRTFIDNAGRLLLNGSFESGGAHLQINGDRLKISTPKTPTSATATGTTGEICWDSNYIYVCTATNTWKRAALSTW